MKCFCQLGRTRYPACPHCRQEMSMAYTLQAPYFFCDPCGHYGQQEEPEPKAAAPEVRKIPGPRRRHRRREEALTSSTLRETA